MALQGGKKWRDEEYISFPQWISVLAKEGLDARTVETHRMAIVGFLGFCRTRRAAASVLLAKEYIERRELQVGRRDEALRAGLRWFFGGGSRGGAEARRMLLIRRLRRGAQIFKTGRGDRKRGRERGGARA